MASAFASQPKPVLLAAWGEGPWTVWTGLLNAERGTWQGSSTGGPAPAITWRVALTTHQADLEPLEGTLRGPDLCVLR